MIICADDYGLAEDIDSAILDLCACGKLSAVSCMVGLTRCDSQRLRPLLELQSRVDIGLHLCFTTEPTAFEPAVAAGEAHGLLAPYSALLRAALGRRLSPAAAVRQVRAQYDLFLAKAGRKPDFIDGHLHAHQLPIIRQALVECVGELPVSERPYMRNTWLPLRRLWARRLPWVKALLIGAFGRRCRALLRRTGIRTNNGFAGIYDFNHWAAYPRMFPRFLECLPERTGMLVVHPGHRESWRSQEYAVLKDHAFSPGLPNRFLAAGT